MRQIAITSSLRTMVVMVMVLYGGCGPSVPDGTANGSSPSPVRGAQVDRSGDPISSPMSRVATVQNRVEHGDAKATTAEQTEDRSSVPELSIPQSIANGLSSSDAGNRYRALDYWEAKDSQAPLEPVFEALEDEDEAVRGKAEAIVERRWKEEDFDEG